MKQASDLRIPFTWQERRPIILERFFYLPPCDEALYDPSIFTERGPLAIEYCSGNGEWITRMALQQPQFQWIAVEKCFERARKIWLNIFAILFRIFLLFAGMLTPSPGFICLIKALRRFILIFRIHGRRGAMRRIELSSVHLCRSLRGFWFLKEMRL